MSPDTDQLAVLIEIGTLLARRGTPYALIGGIAVGIHSGIPRATLDIDLAVPSATDRPALVEALRNGGFRPSGSFAHSLNFRHASGEPVQFAIDPSFDQAIARAAECEVRGVKIRLVGREDLIAMKLRAAGDPARRRSKSLRDQADVELLRGDVPDTDEGW